MNRRGFIKGVCGFVAGGIGALLGRKAIADHVREVTEKVKSPLDFWDDEDEDVYDETDGLTIGTTNDGPLLNVTPDAVYLDGHRLPADLPLWHTNKRRTATVMDEWA